MKRSDKAGFTIIETMLFLGITGLLIVGILAGAGVSINIQRYRDSITSLQSFFQQQYSNVSNVNNDNSGNLACYGDNSVKARGQSDCVILGKYITTSADGNSLIIKSIVGYTPSGTISSSNDLSALQQYNIKVSSISSETYNTEWGTSLVSVGNHGIAKFSVLIVRSPLSGVLRTFIDPTTVISDNNVASLINTNALKSPVKACVNSNGLFTGATMAVLINAGISSSSGVETLGDNSGC